MEKTDIFASIGVGIGIVIVKSLVKFDTDPGSDKNYIETSYALTG